MSIQCRPQAIRKVDVACQRRRIRLVAASVHIETRVVYVSLHDCLPFERQVLHGAFGELEAKHAATFVAVVV